MRSCIIVLFLIWLSGSLTAQESAGVQSTNDDVFGRVTSRTPGSGVVRIQQPPEMNQLVMTHIAMNKRASGIEGFRVQLYSGSGGKARQEALDVKSKVLSQLPSEQIYVEYNAPFWRVRVGSFRHKHEALPLLHQLKGNFPNCYVVKDSNVKLSDLP